MNEQEFLAFFAGLFDETEEGLEMDTEFRYLDGCRKSRVSCDPYYTSILHQFILKV